MLYPLSYGGRDEERYLREALTSRDDRDCSGRGYRTAGVGTVDNHPTAWSTG